MTLSVCIIFHNQKQFIKRCLDSILSQKINFDYEILLSDDNSTDGTWEELLEWKTKHPDLISCYRINTAETIYNRRKTESCCNVQKWESNNNSICTGKWNKSIDVQKLALCKKAAGCKNRNHRFCRNQNSCHGYRKKYKNPEI